MGIFIDDQAVDIDLILKRCGTRRTAAVSSVFPVRMVVPGAAAQLGSDPRHHFQRIKRLGDIVIRP